MTLVWLPTGTTVRQLARAGLSPGLMSPGLGAVPAEQTYLDVTQGNRVFDTLYDTDLTSLGRRCEAWKAVVERAESAPADIVPGLLQSKLRSAGVVVRRGVRTACAFSVPGPRTAASAPPKKLSEGPSANDGAVFEVRNATLSGVSSLARRLRGEDLLIAVARPAGESEVPLPIGVAGRGFDGDLTSQSTRLGGYVLSTDLAPTILGRFGIPVPSQMSGQPLESSGRVDAAAVERLDARITAIADRRAPVLGVALAAWLIATALAAVLSGGRLAPAAVRVLALSVVYLPAVLLIGAGTDASQAAEQLLVALGAPLLAAATLLLGGGYRSLALASAITVTAYAVDVVAGSPLTALSLLGPNPGLGVRFYGIGNELEALLAVLVVAGTGAWITAFAPRASRGSGAAAFLAVGLGFAFVFAAGRFGADVGAAIVMPLGAAVAAAVLAGRSRRRLLLVLAAPVVTVALLALIDLLSGANAHLTRSVLDAGGLRDLADVAQRRLQLSAHSFARPVVFVFLPLLAVAGACALVWRQRIAFWLRGRPALGAGLAGALAATAVGTLANDSGALLLEIGGVYLIAFAAFAWAEASDPHGRYS